MRTAAMSAIVLVLLAADLALAAGPVKPPAPPAPIPRADGTIRVDGSLDEAAWERAWKAKLPYEVHPGENTPAPIQTEVLLTFTRDSLYVAFKAYDPDPKAIRAHLSDRDAAWNDDWVGVVLDTFNDQRRDYLLLVNPLGVQMDNIEVTNGNSEEWDGIWESAARIVDWGWAVEMRIPFSSLSFQRRDGPQVWGFDAVRGYPRSTFRQMGAFVRDRNNNCYLCQAIKITGFDFVTPGRNIEAVPTVTATGSQKRITFPVGPLSSVSSTGEAGLTGRWGLTPNLTLNGTVNPDFSHVEADALQLDINEPFALSYPEKRPFFMEASDFFTTPLSVVYTRSIRDPAWGGKLTGKEGNNTVGVFVTRDELTNLIVPGSQTSGSASLQEASFSSVVRYKRDVTANHTIGIMATDREGSAYFNRLLGFDGHFRPTPKDRLRVQLLGSSTRYPETVVRMFGQQADAFSDWAADVDYTHSTRNLYVNGKYTTIGAGFRADLGFMPRVDYRRARGTVQYQWLPKGQTWYTNLAIVGTGAYLEDQRGNLLSRSFSGQAVYQGPLQSHAALQFGRTREAFMGRQFDQTTVYLHNCMQPSGGMSTYVNLNIGDRIDYANARPGRRVHVDAGTDLRIGRHLLLSVGPSFERMRVDGGRLYTALQGQVGAGYQFTPRVFVRTIVQYVDYRYNVGLYAVPRDPRNQSAYVQTLFSYKVNPRTVWFVGYTDNRMGTDAYVLTQRDRTLFTKVGYAWTF